VGFGGRRGQEGEHLIGEAAGGGGEGNHLGVIKLDKHGSKCNYRPLDKYNFLPGV
jgi:hypothetical protein